MSSWYWVRTVSSMTVPPQAGQGAGKAASRMHVIRSGLGRCAAGCPVSDLGLGLGSRGAFGKGRGLPFAATLRFIEFLFQLGQARFEFRNAGGLLGNQGLRLLQLLHQFVVGHDVFKIHAGAQKGNPTFL